MQWSKISIPNYHVRFLAQNLEFEVVKLLHDGFLRVKLSALLFQAGDLLGQTGVLVQELLHLGGLVRRVVLSDPLLLQASILST